jgi:hypothetical protein
VNLTELRSAIIAYTENTELTNTLLDTFIRQAEQFVTNEVQLPASRKSVSGSFTASNRYLSTPSDFLSAHSLAVLSNDGLGTYSFLLDKDVEWIRAAFDAPGNTGLPKYYALFNNTTFIVGPTPNANYSAELHYFAYPASITDPAGTSWLGDNFDGVLLYGALIEAYTYMKGEKDLLVQYQTIFAEKMRLLKKLIDGKTRQDTYRTVQTRVPVE